LVIKMIRDFLKLHEPIPWALDVVCGTGQSILALKEVASQVVGTETSREMLDLTERHAKPACSTWRPPRRNLPFADGSLRLVTVALALHWFERSRFLTEASRVLSPGGWLIIHDNGFCGEMKENPEHERWYSEDYLHATSARPIIKSLSQRMSAESMDLDSPRGKGRPTRFRSLPRSSPATI
jgi:ubiquinone/menaquinone biosynthesis C-methylase UbiE